MWDSSLSFTRRLICHLLWGNRRDRGSCETGTYADGVKAATIAANAAIAAAGDDDYIEWKTLDEALDLTQLPYEQRSSHTTAAMGLHDPRTMSSGLKKWVLVANDIWSPPTDA